MPTAVSAPIVTEISDISWHSDATLMDSLERLVRLLCCEYEDQETDDDEVVSNIAPSITFNELHHSGNISASSILMQHRVQWLQRRLNVVHRQLADRDARLQLSRSELEQYLRELYQTRQRMRANSASTLVNSAQQTTGNSMNSFSSTASLETDDEDLIALRELVQRPVMSPPPSVMQLMKRPSVVQPVRHEKYASAWGNLA